MDPALLSGLTALVILLLLSFFFSAARVALGTVRRPMLREMAERGNHRALRAVTIAEDSSRVLNTFHLVNVLTHFLIAGLAIALLLTPVAAWIAARLPMERTLNLALSYVATALPVALVVYVLIEMLPETLAHRDAEGWAMALAGPAQITMVLLSPLVWVMTHFRRAIPTGQDKDAVITEEEIMTLVDAGEEEGSIDVDEKEMIYSIFQLDDTLAREIMVPRIDIVAVDVNTPLEGAREVIIKAGHSRIPVYEGSLDNIVGLLYAKDLLDIWHTGKDPGTLRPVLRRALFVPESKRVPDLLHEMQSSKLHLAIVIDEYGGTAGLVTIEDIVEEIVGEIFDEYDPIEEAPYETVGPDEFVFDARMSLDDFNRLLDVELPDEHADTLGGFIYGELGKVPEQGEVVQTATLVMEVTSVEDRRIRRVRVRRISPQIPPPAVVNGKDQTTSGTHH